MFSMRNKINTNIYWLTHCSLETPKRVFGKQNAASDQGLHCLQTVQPFFSRYKPHSWTYLKLNWTLPIFSVGESIQSTIG